MKYSVIITLVLGCTVLNACRRSETPDDPEKLKQVLIDYFDGIKNNDHKKMREATTGDFLLYEMGHVWNNDSVFMNMERNSPYTVEFKFDNFKINVDQMSGHMAYFGHAAFVFGDTTKQDLSFVENAAFRKEEGKWKMNFLHTAIRK